MANTPNRSNGDDQNYPTTEDVIRALANSDETIFEANKIIDDSERSQARRDNDLQLVDDLMRHFDENRLIKSQKIFMALLAEAEIGFPGSSLYKNGNFVHFLNKHAASRGLDDRTVELISEAANRDRKFARGGIRFKLPKELQIQLNLIAVMVLKGVITIVLYLALFFILYKIVF